MAPALVPQGRPANLTRDPPGVAVDRRPGIPRNHSCFFTQNLFGKMADILEKIKK